MTKCKNNRHIPFKWTLDMANTEDCSLKTVSLWPTDLAHFSIVATGLVFATRPWGLSNNLVAMSG